MSAVIKRKNKTYALFSLSLLVHLSLDFLWYMALKKWSKSPTTKPLHLMDYWGIMGTVVGSLQCFVPTSTV